MGDDRRTARYEEAEGLVPQYRRAKKTSTGVNWVVGALVFSGLIFSMFFTDGSFNFYFSLGSFGAIAASLLFVTRHNRTLMDQLQWQIKSLRRMGNPPFHVGELLGLSSWPSGGGDMLVGEVMRVEPVEVSLGVKWCGTALILSEPIRGVMRAGFHDTEFEIKKGDMVYFVYWWDGGVAEICGRLGWRDAVGARLEMETRGQIDNAKRLAREWTATHPQDAP